MVTLVEADIWVTNWFDLESVKKLADKLGPGMTVIKRPDIDNYNIIHTSREPDLLRDATVLYRTK